MPTSQSGSKSASPKVRKFARELGANVVEIPGSQRGGRVSEEDVKNFVDFRHEVVVKRTEFELRQAEARAHILEGLKIALDNIDAVIELIKASKNPDAAKEGLMNSFKFKTWKQISRKN